MSRQLTESEIIEIAKIVAINWESIPSVIASFRNEFNPSNEALVAYETMLRSLNGGEDTYNYVKEFLSERNISWK